MLPVGGGGGGGGGVRRKIQAAIGEYDELLVLVRKRGLRWFGHVSRSSGLAGTILRGTVRGGGKGGRRREGWEDSVGEWADMDFAGSAGAAGGGSGWGGGCCEFICGAPTTFQGYGIE